MFRYEDENIRKMIGIQFFADSNSEGGAGSESEGGAGSESEGGEGGRGVGGQSVNENTNGKDKDKSEGYDNNQQIDLEAEKKKWLKELGFEDDDDEEIVKGIAQKHREDKEKKMTDEQKAERKLLEEKTARLKAEREAAESKAMVDAMKKGAKPDCVEDVITLAMKKCGGKADKIDSAIEEVKKAHPSMFTEVSENDDKQSKGKKGTGGIVKKKEGSGGSDGKSLGARLAKMRSSSGKKSVYFGK